MHPPLKIYLTLCPKTSSDSSSITVTEQLHLLTTEVDQLRITLEQALEQTKPLIQTFPLANIKQFQYLQAVQRKVAQFFVDLIIEKYERLKLCTAISQLEDELAQLCREVNKPPPPTSFTPCSFYSRPTVFYCFPRHLCPKQCPNIKAFDYNYPKKNFEHYIQIPAT